MFFVWLENYVNLRKNCQICKCSEGMLTSLKQLLQVCHAMILCLFCFKSFSKNIKDFLKKFKDFFRKLLHVFRCANMAVGCWCVAPASATASFLFFLKKIFFSLLYFSFLYYVQGWYWISADYEDVVEWSSRDCFMIVAWLSHDCVVLWLHFSCDIILFSILLNIIWYMSVCRFYESCAE